MARKQRRVLQVIGQLQPGGIETWLLNMMRYDERLRDESAICCVSPNWDGVYRSELEHLGVPIFTCQYNSLLLPFALSLSALIRHGGFSVVHSHLAWISGVVSVAALLGGSSRRISHYHSVPLPWHQSSRHGRWYLQGLYALDRLVSTDVVGITKHVLEQNFGRDWARDARRRVIYYGIPLPPTAQPSDPSIRQEFGIPKHALVVGHVGRFEAQKNHRFIIELAEHLIPRYPNLHFLLVGDGPLRTSIERAVAARGMADNVHLVGVHRDVPSLMRSAMDVFLFPSLFEGLGLAMIEAQTAGLRCLASANVCEEAAVVPGAAQFLPLSAGIQIWGETLIGMLHSGQIDAGHALEHVRSSRFLMQACADQLRQLYQLD